MPEESINLHINEMIASLELLKSENNSMTDKYRNHEDYHKRYIYVSYISEDLEDLVMKLE